MPVSNMKGWRAQAMIKSSLCCIPWYTSSAYSINYDGLLTLDPPLVSNNGHNGLNSGFMKKGTSYQKNFVLWLKRVKQVDNEWTFWDCKYISLCNNCRKRQYQVTQIIKNQWQRWKGMIWNKLLGSLSKHDVDESENVIWKCDYRFLQSFFNYSNSVCLKNGF